MQAPPPAQHKSAVERGQREPADDIGAEIEYRLRRALNDKTLWRSVADHQYELRLVSGRLTICFKCLARVRIVCGIARDSQIRGILPTVQSFQGSGFSVELPDDATDATAYCFVFPDSGEYSPNLTIRSERSPDDLDLKTYVNEQTQALETSVENFVVVNEISNKHGFWTYIISIIEWGPEESRIRQKRTFMHVPGEIPRLFTLTGTDLASNFEKSEVIFNQVIKSFKPNDIQAI